ncbi:MAG: alanine--tRNA ligase [Bacteroidetes bacterium]|nr:alanine--tRNA ligase [Bacteroidota bacterium]MBP6315179.1 alanine--tRNA ligase [Chitinophagaceae bacterium]
MTSSEIRQQFLDFFKSKGHHIVSSAPIVVKNDPTLMFTNAGMNQFKDYFLGNQQSPFPRIADTQKCLRVSGKHNDLEEVGVDTYHHTMFEMLGNWSFGNYFKAEAIAWSWELLTEVYKLDKDRLYVSVFEGDQKEGIPASQVALEEWQKLISDKDHIVYGKKKDNFWEMGDTGPCGPCSEIHVDMRPDAERALIPGHQLVNADHPQVIEIWNNVFIQYNRKKDGSLENLPAKHVDTGMGFERLVRVIQGKTSNYDTDVFTPTIEATEKITGFTYDFGDSKQAIAFRVLADHIRAIAFTIADGQLPSNTGAGYVIRRILRRAVRYYFSFLNYKQPLLSQLLPLLATQFEHVFPELKAQENFVQKVIHEEESGFLRTLDIGLKRMDDIIAKRKEAQQLIISGAESFELSDTYGFPIDLTQLIAIENNCSVDVKGFEEELQKQKDRSRKDAKIDSEDWVMIHDIHTATFVGYDHTEAHTRVWKYRKVSAKGKTQYQMVLESTPFYAESGGQVGDTGILTIGEQTIHVTDTKKENDLIIHFVDSIPDALDGAVIASIDTSSRRKIQRHHTATHLVQAALQQVLGKHIAQKGSLNNADYMRFDFSHFAKMTDEEIMKVEKIVNQKIRQNIPVVVKTLPKDEAMQLGAMALFGEKYGDIVRVVIIDPSYSIELCGGTHVANTGELGIFKITAESAIAAGVRRLEALAGCKAEHYINHELKILGGIKATFKNPKDLLKSVESLVEEKNALQKQLERLEAKALVGVRNELLTKVQVLNGVHFIGEQVEVSNPDALRKICTDLKNEIENYVVVLTANIGGKAAVALLLDENLANNKGWDAPKLIKEHIANLIKGGGGGQKTFASAGGTDASQLDVAIKAIKALI